MISRDTLWQSGRDESVEVNQRALIDKIFARYSGEFTVFRELLQNSDDAQSETVEIRFETQEYISRNVSDSEEKTAAHRPRSIEESLPDLKTTSVQQWIFKNNGNTFREEDWDRLKKIADGNPDEEKIGAFGVGFYSVFSVTEEPFVTSGNQWMGFYWKDKKDRLFARRGQLPQLDKSPKPWTSFTIPLREPAPMPLAFDFARFLATSLTFMKHLNEVCVYLDDRRLVKLNKAHGMRSSLGLPKGLENSSPGGTMTVNNIHLTSLVIKAQVMEWIYTSGTERHRQIDQKPMKLPAPEAILSSLPSSQSSHASETEKKRQIVQKPVKISSPVKSFFSFPFSQPTSPASQKSFVPSLPVTEKDGQLAIRETSISLSIYSASIQVRLEQAMASEIQRSTKKHPPAKMKLEFIYTTKEEYDASLEEEAKYPEATGSIFQGLRADIHGQGAARVFIGHSTAQTTGIGGHIAARFIPTVERESIDLMNYYVKVWNMDLLYVGGFLSRAVYEFEMSAMQRLWTPKSNPVDPTEAERITNKVLHMLQFFAFHRSTPSPKVSSLMESVFFKCPTDSKLFPVISNHGVCDVADVCLPEPALSFLKALPVLPQSITTSAPLVVNGLWIRGMIRKIEFRDVFRALRSQPLAQDEFVSCVNWWTAIFQKENMDLLWSIRTKLIDSMELTYENNNGIQKVIRLSSIKTFINPSSPCKDIPSDSPLPDHLLPLCFSKLFQPETLSHAFPWTELTIVQWLSYICKQGELPVEYNLDKSRPWAERVIGLIGPMWSNFPAESKLKIIPLLQLRSCIPTSCGMSLPQDAYFPVVNAFSDLPIVTFTSGLVIMDSIETFLQDLGVRKHVELQVICYRMIHTKKWTVADLMDYLESDRAPLPPEELRQLSAFAAFPQEGYGDSGERFTLNQLYEPLDVFRRLKLPIIHWGQKSIWMSSSEEAKFLFTLGLQRKPPLPKLIELCAGDDPNIRSVALDYLLTNMDTEYCNYDPLNFKNIKFIPALKGPEPCLGTIDEVFSPPWAVVGFFILQPLYQPFAVKMKIQDQPAVSQLMSILREKPPKTDDEAKHLFTLLSNRVHDFNRTDLDTLSTTAFVPTKFEKGPAGAAVEWKPPSQCYLFADEEFTNFYSNFFSFVDFGAAANTFLAECGTRRRPSAERVAKILLASPQKFYELAGGHNNFLSELRRLAANARDISAATLSKMKDSPILLGLQRKGKREAKTTNTFDKWDIIHELKKPKEIIVVDDNDIYQAFSDSLFTAPREDDIEAFYCHLGSVKLTDVVRETYQKNKELRDSKPASDVRMLVLERLPLFLHEQTQGRTRISSSWLSENKNFTVRAFEKLEVTKQLAHGNLKLRKTEAASAVARRDGSGPVELWIAGNLEIDLYEVAKSLNRLFFLSPKAHDTLVFMTILSTNLQSLARRGYNVDRIRRQQEAEKESKDLETMSRKNHKKAPLITNNVVAIKSGHAQQVTEELNDGYCDISGAKINLRYIGQIGFVSVYLSEEIPVDQTETFMEQRRQSISRFTAIIEPLAKIYDLPLPTFHIFYDLQNDFIAFNRTGSIFLSLRYFETSHDSDVKNGELQQAYTSWYFTIAHEIAHNLVQLHNVEHEFYFSALCEQYMMQLLHYLAALSGGQPGTRK